MHLISTILYYLFSACKIDENQNYLSPKTDLQIDSHHEMIQEQVNFWQVNIKTCYKKPILGFHAMNFIKLMCDYLMQHVEVFLMSTDLIEVFLNKINATRTFNEDILTIASAITVSSKSCGSKPQIDLLIMEETIRQLTGLNIHRSHIRKEELNFVITVQAIPSSTLLTDVNMLGLANNFVVSLTQGTHFEAICVEITTIFYLCKKDICSKLESVLGEQYFAEVMSNKLYVTCGIVLAALQFTAPQKSIDLLQVSTRFEDITSVQTQYLILLVKAISEYLYCN